MKILGISAFYHDSAAALLIDGKIIAAAQEERFTRIKHDPDFPEQAIKSVLAQAGISATELDYVAFYDKPFLKFERLLETYLATAPKGFNSFRMAMPVWLREKLFLKDLLLKRLRQWAPELQLDQLLFSEHHQSHAASAFYPSPFEQAVVLTLDGVGEWATTAVAIGQGRDLQIKREIHFPHSLGLLYSAFTYYAGFKVNSGEYKLMGLAPYGEPRYQNRILDHLIDLKDDGSFRLNQDYFNYATGLTMTSRKFHELFGQAPRVAESGELTQFYMDMAASIQAVTETAVLRMTRELARTYQIPNLCLAGGVALNCVANGKIHRDGHFDNLWVQPAAGDAGGALGAALAAWHIEFKEPRTAETPDAMRGSYLGPKYSDEQIEQALNDIGAVYERHDSDSLLDSTARLLADGKAVGWFQGRMEFGPRALGARSILADPRSEFMQRTLNLKIKFRESFRPFAPAVLAENVDDWFEHRGDSPYMLLVAELLNQHRCQINEQDSDQTGFDRLKIKRSSVPAITHVDNSARIQTVDRHSNPLFHQLITQFTELTGCPMLVNTSFNVRGEPLVCTPEDAYRCFMGTGLDVLVIGNFVLNKEQQDLSKTEDYQHKYHLD